MRIDWEAIFGLLGFIGLFLFGTVRPVNQQINIRPWFDSHWRRWHVVPAFAFLIVAELFLRDSAPQIGPPARWLIGMIMTGTLLIAAYRLKEAIQRVRRGSTAP